MDDADNSTTTKWNGRVGGAEGTWSVQGPSNFAEAKFADLTDAKTFDRIVSTETEETKYPDGSIQSKTTTTTYASGKTVVTE